MRMYRISRLFIYFTIDHISAGHVESERWAWPALTVHANEGSMMDASQRPVCFTFGSSLLGTRSRFPVMQRRSQSRWFARVVVVVGASRGLGLGLVRHYANQEGTTVIGTARSLKDTSKYPKDSTYLQVDVTDPESVKGFAEGVAKMHRKVDLLINNAGIIVDFSKWSLETVDRDSLMKVYETNAVGPLLVVQAFLRQQLLSKGSLVANVTSKVGS